MDKDKKTILLVDDDDGNRCITAEILEDLGYQVISEAGGSAALSVIKNGGVDIDLLITDYCMPDMSGLDLVTELRRILPDVPVIMMTAYGSIDNYFKSMSLGVFEYVHKPVGNAEFERIIKKALHKPGGYTCPPGNSALDR